MEKLFLKTKDNYDLPVWFFPKEDPKGLFQIIHGSLEHKGRYLDFCNFLNDKGYAVIISDNRGHGQFKNDVYPSAHFKGTQEIIDDLLIVTKFIKDRYPNKKLTLFGHSLGSQLARVYIQKHDDLIDKLILTGTVEYEHFAFLGKPLATLVGFLKGSDTKTSKFLLKLSGIGKDEKEWLSYSQQNINNKNKDELFAKEFTIGGYKVLFDTNNEIRKVKHYQCKNPSLKIISLNGDGDFLTGYDKGLTKSMNYLKKVGYKNVSYKRYDHMLHEILNEDNHQIVYDDILKFISE